MLCRPRENQTLVNSRLTTRMEQNDDNKLAKEFCQSFLLERIKEAQRISQRLAACECDFFGGEMCQCTNSTNIQIVNGGVEDSEEPIFSFSLRLEKDLMASNGDEKDSSALRKQDDHVIGEIPEAGSMSDTQMTSSAATTVKIETSKPLIKQCSFMEHVYDGLRDPYVIMINNVNFKKRPAPRNGAETDTKNLKKFLQKAEFNTVECHFDVNKDDMMRIFQKAQKNYNLFKHDGLVCFIMSHGNSKGIEASDNQYIKVDDITTLFRGNHCPQFATKPKLFFIQACRGDEEDDGYLVPRGPNCVESDSEQQEQLPVKMPSDSDFLIAYSTTKEKCSYRRFTPCRDVYMENELMGSWFIASLVDVLLAYSHEEDLLSMLTRVNKAMAELYTDMGQKQISCHLSMLTKKIYFPTFMEK